jgi:hypothetical protein
MQFTFFKLSCWCRIKTKSAKLCLITIEYLLGTIGEFDKFIGFYFRKFFRLAQFNPFLGHLDPLANDANFYVHVNLRHNKKLCTKIKIKWNRHLNSCRLYCLSHLIPATIHMFSLFLSPYTYFCCISNFKRKKSRSPPEVWGGV